MDVTIHGYLNGGMTQKLMQDFGRYTSFDGSGRISVSQSVHTKPLYPCLITKLVQVGIIG